MTDTVEAPEVQADTTDYLGMSDEDFLKQPEPVVQSTDTSVGETDTSDANAETEEEGKKSGSDEGTLDGDSGSEEGGEQPPEGGSEPFSDDKSATADATGDTAKGTQDSVSDSASGDDYKAKYEAVLAPFKANGKEITVDNPEDLRRLAQMGVNYNSKMRVLKPNLKLIKMLENNDLLDEEKLNFLIDLSKKDSNAINKLVKDSGISPLDIDTESTEGYKPNTYTVNDKQFQLDEALADLKESPTYSETIDVISTKWDEASRRVLADSPEIIQIIDNHMQTGVFQKVFAAMERDKMLGRIPKGLSDLDAYKYVGDQLYAKQAPSQNLTTTPLANSTDQPDANTQRDVERNKRKRAAGTLGSKPAKQTTLPTNALALSDEEFEKLMPSYL